MLIVDSQIHLWQNGKMSGHHRQIPTYSADDALAEMATAGVDGAVIHPPSSLGEAVNTLAVEAVRQHPATFCILGHFDLDSPDQHLASINRITLDIDLARLVNHEEFLRSITLAKASLTLPVDPRDSSTEIIRVRDLNARLIIKGRQIEIAQAEADLSGIHLIVRGDVSRG